MSGPPLGRRRGPSTARDDILDAARASFAERGYERSSLRSIARRAKVDPALIIHYFESKEGLLREALTPPRDPAEVVGAALADVAPERVGEELVRRVIAIWDAPAMTPVLQAMLRTALADEAAMSVLRDQFQRTVLSAVSVLVGGDGAGRRAELVAAQMAGLAVARYLLRLPEITAMSGDELARIVGPSVQRYLVGPV